MLQKVWAEQNSQAAGRLSQIEVKGCIDMVVRSIDRDADQE